jgi:hypothetical protein
MVERRKLGDVAIDLLLFAGMISAGIYLTKSLLNPFLSNLADPDKEKHDQARRQAKAHLERLNRRRRVEGGQGEERKGDDNELVLNEYENLVALEMVAPEDIHVGFDGSSLEHVVLCFIIVYVLPRSHANRGQCATVLRYWRT